MPTPPDVDPPEVPPLAEAFPDDASPDELPPETLPDCVPFDGVLDGALPDVELGGSKQSP